MGRRQRLAYAMLTPRLRKKALIERQEIGAPESIDSRSIRPPMFPIYVLGCIGTLGSPFDFINRSHRARNGASPEVPFSD